MVGLRVDAGGVGAAGAVGVEGAEEVLPPAAAAVPVVDVAPAPAEDPEVVAGGSPAAWVVEAGLGTTSEEQACSSAEPARDVAS
jgi:hypothetical protein